MKGDHRVPILSRRCDGFRCRTCPRAWRYFVTGMEIWGHGDNATWLSDATEDYRRGPAEKLTRARWRRVVRRWILIGLPALLVLLYGMVRVLRHFDVGWALWPWGWLLVLYPLAGIGIGTWLALPTAVSWWSTREVRSTYIYPAAAVLSKITGVRIRRRYAMEAIVLPPGFGDGPALDPVRIYLPNIPLDAGMKQRITEMVGARLGLPNAQGAWTEDGVEQPYVELRPQPLPPKRVSIEDLAEELKLSTLDEPLIGVTAGGQVARINTKKEPHTLGSAASGTGKSTLYKLVAMQRLERGAYAVILDFKKWSHLRWAGRLPEGRVLIEDEIPNIHDTLTKLLDELLWRKGHDLDQEEELAQLPTIDVYVEEINSLMIMLTAYWKQYVASEKVAAKSGMRHVMSLAKNMGEGGLEYFAEQIAEAEEALTRANGLPIVSPAVQALRLGVNLGREFNMHFHFIGQSLDAAAVGGRNTRASFKTRMLAAWTKKDWKMLADEIPYVQCPSGDVGIWALVHGQDVSIVRVPFVPDAFAVQYVLDGIQPSLPMFHGDERPSIDVEFRPAIPSTAPLSVLISVLPDKKDGSRMTLKALQRAKESGNFPAPVEKGGAGKADLFSVEEVLAWFADREGLPALRS